MAAAWRRWQGREGGPPPAYRSGFGAEGVKMLQAFVQKGGTLVTFGQAADLPIQRFNLPVRNVVAGLSSKEFWSPGSTLRVRFDPRHPLAYGMPRDGYALFLAGSQAYEVTTSSPNVEIFATFVEREILQSGWLLGEGVIAQEGRRGRRSRTARAGSCCLDSARSTGTRRTGRSSWCSTRC